MTRTQEFWERRCDLLAWQINLAAWLMRAAPAGFLVATPFAIVFYALRRTRSSLEIACILLVAAAFAVAFVCWLLARRQFFRRADARVLLESHLRLDTRLTAAALKLVDWPAAPAPFPRVLSWRLRAPLAWFASALTVLSLSLWAPVPAPGESVRPGGGAPALAETEALLSELSQTNVVEPQALEQFQQRVQELARRPVDEQFSHSALEAADALRDQTVAAAADLSRSLENAAESMQSPDMKEAAGLLAGALSGLRDGLMSANKELLSKMPNAAELKNLTAAQRAELAKQLRAASRRLSGVAGAGGANAKVARPIPSWLERRGAGGEGGGGGHAPLTLSSARSEAGEGKAEALSADSLKNIALGDKLGTTSGAHDVDTTKLQGQVSAGAVAAPASGGDAAWVNRLTPAERAALKEFFK